MKCNEPGCGGDLRVTNTYTASDTAKTQSLVCKKCGKRMTAVTLLHSADGYGNGAAAVAKKLKKQCSKKEG